MCEANSWDLAEPACSNSSAASPAIAAACMLAVAGVATAGLPVGLQLAAAVVADPTNSGHVMLPVMLLGEGQRPARRPHVSHFVSNRLLACMCPIACCAGQAYPLMVPDAKHSVDAQHSLPNTQCKSENPAMHRVLFPCVAVTA